ncbi:hypothetical protein MD484_g3650, partial [Candolleomyces efflorescens]
MLFARFIDNFSGHGGDGFYPAARGGRSGALDGYPENTGEISPYRVSTLGIISESVGCYLGLAD